MSYSFTCQCGFETTDVQVARTHLSRCVWVAPKPSQKPDEPIIILVTALEEMNKIITEALTQYRSVMKAKEKKNG